MREVTVPGVLVRGAVLAAVLVSAAARAGDLPPAPVPAPAGDAPPAPASAPATGAAPDCARRYADLFVRVPSIGLSNPDTGRAATEVRALFGATPQSCEAGGYQRFLEGFRDYAREAMRARGKHRDGMLRTAIALLLVSPVHVPPDDVRGAVTGYRQVRSDLVATATDVKATPLIKELLDAFERAGTPVPDVQKQVVPDSNTQQVRIPTSPLPPWVVISLYEMLELHKQKNYEVAQGKLEVVLKWLETAP